VKVGAVYLLRGGHVLRYQGPYANKGPCLAFRGVRAGVSESPSGYSTSQDQVLREVTSTDLDWLKRREAEAAARNLTDDALDMQHVIKELTQ